MWLKNLSIINYKNIEEAGLSFSRKMNCIVGKNGMGKTNLLDAVYYLSFCKSATNPVDSQNILHAHDFFVLQGLYETEDGEDDDNAPPQCQALDGKFGHGSPGGLCDACGYNRFGTRGKGKACKNMHMVYLLRSGEFMPLQISLPPTSIRPFNEFVSRAFLLRRRGICSAVVQLGLKKMNNGKDDYSVTTFKLLRDFEGEELRQIRDYADQFKEQVKVMLAQRAEQADAASGDVVEVGTTSRRLPDNEDHFAIGGVIDGEREELPA